LGGAGGSATDGGSVDEGRRAHRKPRTFLGVDMHSLSMPRERAHAAQREPEAVKGVTLKFLQVRCMYPRGVCAG
jgi:hypothetical protein